MAGLIVLAWPGRRREVVYVVEPSQVPDLIQAIGAPLPLARLGGRHARSRPRTLADASATSPSPVAASLAWPPADPVSAPSPMAYAQATAIPTGPGVHRRPAASAVVDSPPVGEPLGLVGAAAGESPSGLPQASGPLSASVRSLGKPSGLPPVTDATSLPPVTGATSLPPVSGATDLPPVTGATSLPPVSGAIGLSPVSGPSGGRAKSPSGLPQFAGLVGGAGPEAAAGPAPEPRPGPATERAGRRRAPEPATDSPRFEASAVGAWVAETAGARARETEARAAAAVARGSRGAKPAVPAEPGPTPPAADKAAGPASPPAVGRAAGAGAGAGAGAARAGGRQAHRRCFAVCGRQVRWPGLPACGR